MYKSLVTRDSALGRLSQAISTRMTGEADMAMPLMRGVGPTLIPRPQRMYLGFGEPIDTTKPGGVSDADWVASVRDSTKERLEAILDGLLALRAGDPYRELNPAGLVGRGQDRLTPPRFGVPGAAANFTGCAHGTHTICRCTGRIPMHSGPADVVSS